jgi:DNA-binding MarR family transcriptional regulator
LSTISLSQLNLCRTLTIVGKDDDARTAWRTVAELFLSDENHDRFHLAAEAAGVPHPGALKLLLTLEPDDPPSMRELAEVMRCDASWVTSLVDALEEPGLATRVVSPTDRRVKRVQVTPIGVAAKARAMDVLATPPKAIDRLSATEVRTLATILRKLVDG